ncbi:hypothetical protein MCOR27_009369 [Pyricularia oryzae]|uniref:Uncharacterized protein n=5 Tax=Pyricularia TaxID=48558 RepID=A0ABQ8N2P4_PYRGI|nr:uncharacterized protein MGG_05638 [Pyricularia oryzae 70-15]ELQ36952.1 hypothetical protein OOU_Y34scaffold00624g48 [Pyricularia oryzae Y34]KAH8845243.1 hypothetical protein MCOR01_002489 [Pyricularia oryzae]KAI6289887.1 hypothetical protein MCOR33_011664 [Pyricularia grisea]EHA57915.1 hypothetical protein MGG_05638 [Pyricularia oryzae 70-15]KAH9428905.1 hypothetical protein MCOR02_010326 [Pyricularia oryzae]
MKYSIILAATCASTAFAAAVAPHDPALAELVARTGELAEIETRAEKEGGGEGKGGKKNETGKKEGGKKNGTEPAKGGKKGGAKNGTEPAKGGKDKGKGKGNSTTGAPGKLPPKSAASGRMAALSNAGGYVTVAGLGVTFALYM